MRILAVDDDPIFLDLLTSSLSKHIEIELVCSASAEEALNLLKYEPTAFDCFLLDIMLPGIDGIELCARLRGMKDYRTTPIIMITGSPEADLMGRTFAAGATDFLTKPLDPVELRARINAASMLNDSLLREREAQHNLIEATERMKPDFDEALRLNASGVTDLATIENELLRLPAGCYAMSLFSVDIEGLKGVHRAVSPRAFRQHLEMVGEAIVGCGDGSLTKLAYCGGGRFAGLVMQRRRLNVEKLQETVETRLTAQWNPETLETPMPPAVRISMLSDQRMWTGASASDFFREGLNNQDIIASNVAAQQGHYQMELARAVG